MEGGHGLNLAGAAIILGVALTFVTLFRRFGLGAVLGYLLCGALLGPQGLRVVDTPETMLGVADLGIVLLLFLVGMELSPGRLLRLKHDILGLGLLQVVVSGVVIAGLLTLIGFSTEAAFALGLPLALSSTAQVLPSLRAGGEINTRPGERAFSILLFQDLAIVPMLILIASFSRAPADPTAPSGVMLPVYAIGAIAVLVVAGRYLLRPLFRIVGRVSERELFVVAGLFTVLAAAAVMQSLHLSMALGAFVAGVMLADSPYRHELEADIDPFRSILLGLFFVAVGMMLDLHAIADRPLFVIGIAAALVIVKAIVLFALARLFGVENRQAVKMGLLLSQGGEFGFVLFAQAQAAHIILPEASSLFGAVVTLSMATTPFLMMLNDRMDRWARGEERGDLAGPEGSPEARAILVGYGRFGQIVGQMLIAQDISVTLIDSKASQIELSEDFGMKVYYGDGARIDLLRQAGAGEAQAILFCHDDRNFDARKLEPILEAFPQARVFVRAYDRRQVMALEALDVAGVVREVYESAVAMGRDTLTALGLDAETVQATEALFRETDQRRLKGQTESGDLHTLKETIFRPGSDHPHPVPAAPD